MLPVFNFEKLLVFEKTSLISLMTSILLKKETWGGEEINRFLLSLIQNIESKRYRSRHRNLKICRLVRLEQELGNNASKERLW